MSETKGSSTSLRPPRRVLLVEDEPMVAFVARRQLTRLGFAVQPCERVADAIERFREGVESRGLADGTRVREFSAVVTDYRLPDGDGLTLAATLRSAGFQGVIVLVTGDEDVLRSTVPSDVVDHVLAKPYTLAALADALGGEVEATAAGS